MRIIIALLLYVSLAQSTTRYISSSGNDANNGLTQATPWKTPMRLAMTTYVGGDSILFKRGDTWEGQFCDTLQGSPGNPVVIGAYGTGANPLFFGDMRGRTWTATPGHAGVYQCYVEANSEFLTGFYQYRAGAWEKNTNSSTTYRNPFPSEWDLLNGFWDRMSVEGTVGVSDAHDTIFVHLNASATDLSHSAFRMYRYANRLFQASHDYIIRDLEFRNMMVGIYAQGSNMIVRNITTRANINCGVTLINAVDGLADSCRIDSTGDTGFYFVSALRCKVRRSLVMNILPTIDGVPSFGVDRAAVGILDNHNVTARDYGFNTVEYNVFHNAIAGFVDYYFCWGDTVRYNEGHGSTGGAFPVGVELVVTHNKFTMYPSGGNGANMANLGNGSVTFTYNRLDSVGDYGMMVASNDSAGRFYINNNVIRHITSARAFVNYHSVARITSINNTFVGASETFDNFETRYTSLAAFQSATGWEAGSTYSSTVMPDPEVWPDEPTPEEPPTPPAPSAFSRSIFRKR